MRPWSPRASAVAGRARSSAATSSRRTSGRLSFPRSPAPSARSSSGSRSAVPAATITSSTRFPRPITTGFRRFLRRLSWTMSRSRRRPSAIGSRRFASSSMIKAGPLKKQLAALEAPYREKLKASKMTMLSAEERAVLGTPAEKRTPAQKKLAKGLETSLRITWEEVAAAVSANRGRHGASREAQAGYLRDRAIASPPAGACDGTRREEGEGRSRRSCSAGATTSRVVPR